MHVVTKNGFYEMYDIETHERLCELQDHVARTHKREYHLVVVNSEHTHAIIATDTDLSIIDIKDPTWPKCIDDFEPKSG